MTHSKTTELKTLSAAEMLDLEDRAREMRAQAIRHGAAQVRDWMKARFAALFAGAGLTRFAVNAKRSNTKFQASRAAFMLFAQENPGIVPGFSHFGPIPPALVPIGER
jgi:hypothetical protein